MNMLSLNEMMKRDLQTGRRYQLQGEKDSNRVKLACVDKNSDVCIHEANFDDFKCSLLVYTLTDKDIEERKYLMCGYLVRDMDDKVVSALNIMFYPNGSLQRETEGVFKVILTNDNDEHKILREMNTYPGNEHAIYILSELLNDAM